MIKVSAAFLLGVILLQQQAALPPVGLILLLPVFLLLAWRAKPLRWMVGFVAGFAWAWLQACLLLQQALPEDLQGRDLVVEGRVASIPERRQRRLRFEFLIDQASREGLPVEVPQRVRLNWYATGPEPRADERWRFCVRLKRPHGFMNPGGFDYEAWLFQRHIRALGYVRGNDSKRLAPSPVLAVNPLRESLQQALDQALGWSDYRGILTALAIGEKGAIDRDQWRVLRATGTIHLMAISGLHIGLVAGLVFLLARWLWGRSAWLCLRFPKHQAAAVLALLAALCYAMLAGFSIPTQRAMIMLGVVVGATLWRRNPTPLQIVSAALLLVLVIDPLAVLSAGFWLSFAAVGVILYANWGYRSATTPWWRWGRIHLIIALGLLPLMLGLFQQQSLISPLANLVAVPWMSLLVVPLTLLGSLVLLVWPAFGTLLLSMADQAMHLLWTLLETLADWPYASWELATSSPGSLLLAAIGVLIILAPRGIPGRWLGGLFMLPMLTLRPPPPAAGEAWLTLLDVGQGLAAVVQTQHHTLVFDTGPRLNAGFDTGSAVLLPFLRHRGVTRIDTLIVSHGDNDHIGGVASLLQGMPATRVLSSVTERLGEYSAQDCTAGTRWEWDGVVFSLIHPQQPGRLDWKTRPENNNSCVLRVTVAGHAILLPGDIEAAAERELVAAQPEQLRADVLVAPHHGSKTSSTGDFIEAVRPRHVLFPIGYRNHYGFPHPSVLARYRQQGVRVWDSAGHGAITIRLDAQGNLSEPEAWRVRASRYWHNHPATQ